MDRGVGVVYIVVRVIRIRHLVDRIKLAALLALLLVAGCCPIRVGKNVPNYPPLYGEPIAGPDTLYVRGDTLFVYPR